MKLANPIPLFLDARGALLDAGKIYIGEAGMDPAIIANRLDLFWDKDMTIPAAQPLRTLGGVIVNGQDLGFVYFEEADYSTLILDADDLVVAYVPTAYDLEGTSYQPLDADLSAIAAIATTAFGRDLLTLAGAANLRASAGLGTAATLDEATLAQYRANTADKVLTTDQAWGAAGAVPLAEASGTVAVNLANGINFTLAMTGGPWALGNPSNGKPGQSGFIEITQDAAGSRVLTYGANWKFAGGTDPVLSTAANAKDVLFYQVLSDGASIFASLAKGVS